MNQKYCKKVNCMECATVHWMIYGKRLNMGWINSKKLSVLWMKSKNQNNTFSMKLLKCSKTMYYLIKIS